MPPSIVAFSVTPTSGTAPYVVSAVFANKSSIDGVNYGLELRATFQEGTCFVGISSGADVPVSANQLLNNGTYTISNDVAVGSCRTQSLIIRNLVTNEVFDYANIYIDNT